MRPTASKHHRGGRWPVLRTPQQGGNGSIVRANLLKTNGKTDADDADANVPHRANAAENGATGGYESGGVNCPWIAV
jgi:hypothetical protein